MLKESGKVEESGFNIKSIIDQWEVIERIKHYGEIIKAGNKSTLKYESI